MTKLLLLMPFVLPMTPAGASRKPDPYRAAEPLVVSVANGRVFVHVRSEAVTAVGSLQAALAGEGKASIYWLPQNADHHPESYLCNWKIAAGHYWFTTHEWTIDYRPPSYFRRTRIFCQPMAAVAGQNTDHSAPIPNEDRAAFAFRLSSYQLGPLAPAENDALNDDFNNPLRVCHDFIPTSSTSAAFFLDNGKSISVWQLKANWDADRAFGDFGGPLGKGAWDTTWERIETIDASLNSRFQVHRVTGAYLFITDEGKVYVARDTKQGKRKLESLWSDDKHKIGVLVTDAKTGKTFAFSKPRDPKAQPKDEVYFELADPIKPKPFDPAKLPTNSAPEPLNTALQHARFLVAEKLIAEK